MTTFQTPKQYMEQEKHCKNHRKRWTHSRCVGEKWWKHTRGKTSGGLFRLWGRYYPRICGPGFSEPHPYFSERPTAWHWIPSKINVLQLFSITRLHNFGGLGMHHTGAWYLGGDPSDASWQILILFGEFPVKSSFALKSGAMIKLGCTTFSC